MGLEALGMLYYREEDDDSLTTKLSGAVINSLIFMALVTAMTCMLYLMFKHNYTRCIWAYMAVAGFGLFALLGQSLLLPVFKGLGLHLDVVSYSILLWNFTMVGVLTTFFWPAPILLKQGHMIFIATVCAYGLARIPEWTTWLLLLAMAMYDVAAVLTPAGPLKRLMDLAHARNQHVPALVYESGPFRKLNVPRPRPSRRPPTRSNSAPVQRGWPGFGPLPPPPPPAARRRSFWSRSTDPDPNPNPNPNPNANRAHSAAARPPGATTQGPAPCRARVFHEVNPFSDSVPAEEFRLGAPLLGATVIAPTLSLSLVAGMMTAPMRRDERSAEEPPRTQGTQEAGAAGASLESGEQGSAVGGGQAPPPVEGRFQSSGSSSSSSEEDEDGEGGPSQRLSDTIKLGLGDFVFYSVLCGRAAMYDMMTCAACYLGIVAGLAATLVLLAAYKKALPALPISIVLGMSSYALTRYLLEPAILGLSTSLLMF
eukprot:CAMPEP_0114232318 /NCGR_PEP_ID=MMETSP0058-20121206/4538_1 /TAXON_ID=36894 /ORGANISM="Pyramimonas parkeae, CCMP726" /LENGTH=482 /DNA_ID=CAMNT_0001343775 /DNA_START=338 /DNA_END=1786 /DNA_ORIENTATION=+